VNKKKFFVSFGNVDHNAHDPAEQKFLRRFFQKAATFFDPWPRA
jgi:hypothetical protein